MKLTDAKGYRAKYINALNNEVRRIRVTGGDVIPEETEAGTLLRIGNTFEQSRFELFYGLAELQQDSSSQQGTLTNTLCVGNGSFFINGELQILKNATNTKYCSKGIRPRSSGWVSLGAPEKGSSGNAWQYCEVVILEYLQDYYMAFRYDKMPCFSLISEEATEDIESAIQVVMTIGQFTFADSSIVQKVNSDIFINADKPKGLQPWQMVLRDGEVFVVDPVWEVEEPNIPNGVNEPEPKMVGPFADSWTSSFEEDGHVFYRVQDVSNVPDDNFTYAYAMLWPSGYCAVVLVTYALKETPACVLIATFRRELKDGISVVTAVSQKRTGEIHSRWEQTEPFFVENQTGSGYKRLTEAPKGLPEGTVMFQYTFWKLITEINMTPYRESEFINNSFGSLKDEQIAGPRGSFVWRFALHYSAIQKAIMIDSETTAFTNLPADVYAMEMPQPFVERIEVTYPESPLQQGSVDAVGGEIKILQVGQKTTQSKQLFTTESIDTTDGSLIETV